jgi:nucleotide-binding universal stress UspA family protein
MFDHILVPLDGSRLSEEALAKAKHIIAPGSQITLLTAVAVPEIPIYGFDLVGVTKAPSYQAALEEVMQQAKEYLGKITESLTEEGYKVDTVVEFGNPPDVIVEFADVRKVDAIVMATHGRSGVSRWIFGSVTTKVLALAICPVLVVPSSRKQQLLETDKTERQHA